MRIIWTGFGVVLALIALVAMFYLIPAHIQIRSLTPELPSKAELRAVRDLQNGPNAFSFLHTATQDLPGGVVSGHSTFVVEWEDGKILLIDLGMDEDTAVDFGKILEMVLAAEPTKFHGDASSFLGQDVERVRGVAFTHLHVDHVQGVEPLCEATSNPIFSLHTAAQNSEHNFGTADQYALLKESNCIEVAPLGSDDRTADRFPGIGVFPLGGHTPGSTLFAIPIGDVIWLLSGDVSNSRADLLDNKGKGFLYSYLIVPENEERLASIRTWLAHLDDEPDFKVIVSHDANALIESGMDQFARRTPIE